MITWPQPQTAKMLAERCQAELYGQPDKLIMGLSSLEKATEQDLSFCTSPQYVSQLQKTRAGLVILDAKTRSLYTGDCLLVKSPRAALLQLLQTLCPPEPKPEGIHPSAVIHPTVKLGKSLCIEAGVVIGPYTELAEGVCIRANAVIGAHCYIGKNTELKPQVVIYDAVTLGERVLIHSGTVIGGDGFGFIKESGSAWQKMPHLGGVWIGDAVEIGSNTSIDAGMLEPTRIESNVIIDNLVQIGHNVSIGQGTAIAGCVAIAGSVKIGQHCLIGGGSSIAGHLSLSDDVHITGTSAVSRSLTEPGVYSSGLPAGPNRQWRKNVARFQQLDDLARRFIQIEKQILNGLPTDKKSESSAC